MNDNENKFLSEDESSEEFSETVIEAEETYETVNGYSPEVLPQFNNYELPYSEEKRGGINTSLKIACGILVAFIAIFAVYMLVFNPTQNKALKNSDLNGTWICRNGDVVSYYIFEDDGRLMLKSGTVTTVTGYGINLEKDNTFYMYSYGSSDTDNATEMNFKTYKEEGIDTLKIYIDGYEDDGVILQRSDLPKSTLKPSKDFKADSKIVGKWENTENKLALTIGDDGFIQLDFSAVIYDATYTIDGNRVDFTFTTSFTDDTSQTQSFYYELDGDNLMFYMSEPAEGEGYAFTKVKAE